MTRRRGLVGPAAAAAAVLVLAPACGGGSGAASGGETGEPGGDIVVLTNRTDLVDTVFQDYAATFEEQYPGTNVEFEALTDYEGEVKTRMNTAEYGDVLLIPASVPQSDYPDFFEPLGTTDELGQQYNYIDEAAVDGTVYGIATFGNANGFVYNKDVFSQAGITESPTTPDELIADLQKVEDSTDAVPYYTNYKDGWPLSWPQGWMGAVSGDQDALVNMAAEDTPWADGQEKATLDTLLYDAVREGLVEPDPTTTNWESSKNLLATGQISMMPLGSWAIPQMQDAAEKAGVDPAVIGFMPPPFAVDGTYKVPVGGDFKIAVNVNSDNKATAKAWLTWFVEDSGFSDYAGGLSPVKGEPAPPNLQELEASGVEYLEMTPAPQLSDIDNASEIGLAQPDYYRRLVDSARGASDETKKAIYDDLNSRWEQARADVG